MDSHTLLINVVYFLTAAVIAVPIFIRLGLGSVLGYLLAGVIIGPWVLGLISNVEDILHFSEFGVVLLLFLIGLELEPKKLWSMKRAILGSGGTQLFLTTIIVSSLALLLDLTWQAALIIGLGLALSSTAIALQTMQEKTLLKTPVGQTAFSILLFQDIAVIPIIALLPLLSSSSVVNETAHTSLSTPIVIAILIAIFVIGRLFLKHVFHLIAKTYLREVFTMLSLLLVIGIAVIMDSLGISMALGAFLAGVILADSEYRHTLESDIEPFKGLLLGLFFISVGMSIDFGLLFKSPLLYLALAIALVCIKAIVLLVVAKISNVSKESRPVFSILLSQGGEFAFVLFGIAVSLSVLEKTIASQLILIVAISMVLTPLLMTINAQIIEKWLFNQVESQPDEIDESDRENSVIIAGFGRFGQIVGRLLIANKITPTIIDYDPDQIALLKRFGTKAYYGDVLRSDVLHAAGAENATLIVLAIDSEETINAAVEMIKKDFPRAKIVTRAINRLHALELMALGVDHFTRETFYSALEMGKDVLATLGFEQKKVEKQADILKNHDVKVLYEQFAVKDDEAAMISKVTESREQLEQILSSEIEQFEGNK